MSNLNCPGARKSRDFSLHQRNGIFYVQLRHPVTREYFMTKSTKMRNRTEALKIAKKLAADLREGRKDFGNMKLKEYGPLAWDDESPQVQLKRMGGSDKLSSEYLRNNRSIWTNYLNPIIGDLKLKEIRPEDFVRVYAKIRKAHPNLSNSTLANIVNCLKVTCHSAHTLGYIPTDPVPKGLKVTRTGRKRDAFRDAEIEQLLALDWSDQTAKLAVEVAIFAGLRLGEILALKKSDLVERTLRIDESYSKVQGFKCTKSRTVREVVIPYKLAEALRKQIFRNGPETELVFPSTNPIRPITGKSLTSALVMAMRKIGISEAEQKHRLLGFHSFRHWHVSTLRGEVPETVLGKVIGHTDPKTTDRYHHLTEGQKGLLAEVLEARWATVHGRSA